MDTLPIVTSPEKEELIRLAGVYIQKSLDLTRKMMTPQLVGVIAQQSGMDPSTFSVLESELDRYADAMAREKPFLVEHMVENLSAEEIRFFARFSEDPSWESSMMKMPLVLTAVQSASARALVAALSSFSPR
jgi:hypothetical protein